MKKLLNSILKIPSTFRSLPLRTKQLLSFGVIIALFVALPLFVWAIVTQRFELRKKAEGAPSWTINLHPTCSNGGIPDLTKNVTAYYILWPPGEENPIYDSLTPGLHTLNISPSDPSSVIYVGLASQQEGVTGTSQYTFVPATPLPNSAMYSAQVFTERRWAVVWPQASVPSGTYDLNFNIPNDWCTAPPSCAGQANGSYCFGSSSSCRSGKTVLGICKDRTCIDPASYNACQGQANGTSCSIGGCPPPTIGSCYFSCTRPDKIGACQNNTCVPPLGRWTIKTQAICKDGTPANHNTRLYAWSGDPSDLKLRQDLEKGDTPTNGQHVYTWTPSNNYNFVCWGMDDVTDNGNIKPACSTTLGPAACQNNPYCSEGNYSTQRSDSLCNLNHTANSNLQEKFCYEGIASEWLQTSPPPNGDYVINFQAPDSWCGGSCPNGDKGNLNCDSQGLINATDLSILLANWGGLDPCPAPGSVSRNPDLNGDCKVNSTDLSILLANWKPS